MSNSCTITLSDEQYVLLMDAMKLAIAQQRYRLGKIYSGEPFQGDERAVRAMEEKVDNILKLREHLLEKVEWVGEDCVDISPRFDSKVLWVSPTVYERIKNNPDGVIVESQCQPPIILKTVGVGK